MSLRNDYRRDGYVVLRDAVPVPTDFAVGAAIDALQHGWAQSPDEYRLAARVMARGLGALERFLSPAVQTAITELGVKTPIFTTMPAIHVMGIDPEWCGVEAHQDWPSIQTSLNAVTVWMPLTDVGLDNFPLEVVPGSHLMGLLPAIAGEHYSSVDSTDMEFVPLPINRGDVILFSGFTVHRTRTPGAGVRVAMSWRYEDLDRWYSNHDCYAAQSRVISREIKYAPSLAQVVGVFR